MIVEPTRSSGRLRGPAMHAALSSPKASAGRRSRRGSKKGLTVSFDLAFWFQESAPALEEAAQVYDKLTDGETGVVGEDPTVEDFHQAVISVFPDLVEENMNESPWAAPIYATSECVIVAISWSRSREVSSVLLNLASKYGVIAYDPQDQVVYGASGESQTADE